ncbi:hypothetical protein Taro_037248 [Colocasia esculenta]|uniref:Uncharacterized protein n=1 Tax=Colocasia esculenta TaxID=4460 RepID=A0A843W3N7_COLES|nr:hypothetical protein [Colocasia esculenta]
MTEDGGIPDLPQVHLLQGKNEDSSLQVALNNSKNGDGGEEAGCKRRLAAQGSAEEKKVVSWEHK